MWWIPFYNISINVIKWLKNRFFRKVWLLMKPTWFFVLKFSDPSYVFFLWIFFYIFLTSLYSYRSSDLAGSKHDFFRYQHPTMSFVFTQYSFCKSFRHCLLSPRQHFFGQIFFIFRLWSALVLSSDKPQVYPMWHYKPNASIFQGVKKYRSTNLIFTKSERFTARTGFDMCPLTVF